MSPRLAASTLSQPQRKKSSLLIVAVQSLSCVWLFETPWTAAPQASLFFTISRSSPKLTSIELVMPSNNLILGRPLLFLSSVFPSIRVFSNDWLFTSGGQSIGASASALILPMNHQNLFPLGLTGLISLLSKRLSREDSSWITKNFLSQNKIFVYISVI